MSDLCKKKKNALKKNDKAAKIIKILAQEKDLKKLQIFCIIYMLFGIIF